MKISQRSAPLRRCSELLPFTCPSERLSADLGSQQPQAVEQGVDTPLLKSQSLRTMVLVYKKPTKLGDLCGKCWYSYSSTMVRIWEFIAKTKPMTDPWCWYINVNMTGVKKWWDPWHTIYSSTMDPSWERKDKLRTWKICGKHQGTSWEHFCISLVDGVLFPVH